MCQSSIISQILQLIYRTVMIFIFDCVTVQTENNPRSLVLLEVSGSTCIHFPHDYTFKNPCLAQQWYVVDIRCYLLTGIELSETLPIYVQLRFFYLILFRD